jgi:hypothetical protein
MNREELHLLEGMARFIENVMSPRLLPTFPYGTWRVEIRLVDSREGNP